MLENWIPEKVPLSKLLPNENNPRTITKAKLKKLIESLQGVGIFKPIICTWDYKIIGGSQRNIAILELMPASFEVYIMRPPRLLSQEEYDKVLLLDNAHSGEWDIDALANNYSIEMIEDAGIDVTIPPVEVLPTEGLTDEDDVPEVKEPIVRKGDLWLLGKHRLLCGDSYFIDDVERLMDGKNADVLYTDPPYGMNLDTDYSKFGKTSHNVFSKVIGDNKQFDAQLILPFFQNAKEIFLWGADYYVETLNRNYPELGSWIIWDKRSVGEDIGKMDKMFGSSFETCWSKNKHKREIARVLKETGCFAARGEDKQVHPTQKPIALHEFFFERWVDKGDLVVDLFLGSGSTLIACEKTNRKCYGIEIDPHYCTVILNRWRNFTGKEPILESTGQTLKEIEEASA